MNFYEIILVGSFLFFFEQISLLIAIYRDDSGWHFRFNQVEGHSNLNPIVATWKIATVIFLVSIVAIPVIGALFSNIIWNYVNSLQNNFLILISALLGVFFFIWHYMVGKDWNTPQVLIFVGSLVLFALPFYFTYGYLIH